MDRVERREKWRKLLKDPKMLEYIIAEMEEKAEKWDRFQEIIEEIVDEVVADVDEAIAEHIEVDHD